MTTPQRGDWMAAVDALVTEAANAGSIDGFLAAPGDDAVRVAARRLIVTRLGGEPTPLRLARWRTTPIVVPLDTAELAARHGVLLDAAGARGLEAMFADAVNAAAVRAGLRCDVRVDASAPGADVNPDRDADADPVVLGLWAAAYAGVEHLLQS